MAKMGHRESSDHCKGSEWWKVGMVPCSVIVYFPMIEGTRANAIKHSQSKSNEINIKWAALNQGRSDRFPSLLFTLSPFSLSFELGWHTHDCNQKSMVERQMVRRQRVKVHNGSSGC